jgi:tetratricopeptide (TPR) repeat protein
LLFSVGRQDAGIVRCRRALELDPDFLQGWDVLKWIHIQRGEQAEAVEAFLRVVTLEKLHAAEIAGLRKIAERDGIEGLLRASLEHPEARLVETGQSPYNLALDHAALGNVGPALDYLERAFDARETDLVNLAVDPRFESLHDQSRFHSLLAAVGLAAVEFAGTGLAGAGLAEEGETVGRR